MTGRGFCSTSPLSSSRSLCIPIEARSHVRRSSLIYFFTQKCRYCYILLLCSPKASSPPQSFRTVFNAGYWLPSERSTRRWHHDEMGGVGRDVTVSVSAATLHPCALRGRSLHRPFLCYALMAGLGSARSLAAVELRCVPPALPPVVLLR